MHGSGPNTASPPPTAVTATPIAANLLRGFVAERPDQVWVTDATCVLTGQGWLYVVALLDVYTRRIVGWAMHDILDAKLAVAALQMGFAQRKPAAGLIVHSDRGSQFASSDYRCALAARRCVASMSRKGNCYDNAFIESFWSSLGLPPPLRHQSRGPLRDLRLYRDVL